MRKIVALVALVVTMCLSAGDVSWAHGSDYATRSTARSHPGCRRIEQAFLNVGASAQTAQWFAYHIAPRESGCVPVYVKNRTDWSYSVVGLNAGNRGQYVKGWYTYCKRDVRTWEGYEADARCAMAAYKDRGTRPWRASR